MKRGARWVRVGIRDPQALRAAAGGLARKLARKAAPIVLWSASDRADGVAERSSYAVIAANCVAPGKRSRWTAWALSPALAAYRAIGLHAYLDGAEIRLRGSCIARGDAQGVADCAVIVATLDAEARGVGMLPVTDAGEAEFRAWLSRGIGDALAGWRGHARSKHAFETALRGWFEVQHGWQFENSWLDREEQSAVDAACRPAMPLIQ